ncbi:MAG: ShlB/FhaC/HecB family hemolysin secretion/activation protein [Pseudomonadota bacterium]
MAARPQALSTPTVQFTSQRPPSNADQIKFVLNGVEVAGSTAFDEDDFAAFYAEDVGGEVTLTRVFEVAGEIQGIYRDADFIFTRVVVPAQEIDDGVVRIEVIEARITGVQIEEPDGPIGPVRELAERMISPVVGAANPTGAMLERALLNVNEIPGVTRATAVPQADPDDTRGGLQLFINIERDPVEGVIFADNRQTEGIGRGLIGATARYNSYSEWGDTTAISVLNSFAYERDRTGSGAVDGAFDFDERNTVQVVHQRNVGVDGATFEAVGLYSRSRPGDNLADAGIQGEQIFASVGFNYPVVRTRQIAFNLGAAAEFFESETDVSNGALRVSDDRLRIIRATADVTARDEFGYTRASLAVRQGLDLFNASEEGAPDLSRADGEMDFSLLRAEVDRLVVFNDQLSFFGKLAGQYSFDPLLSSEEFAIGGLSYGRGLDPSVFTGEHGIGLSGELRYLYPFEIEGYAITAEAFGFAEYGVIWNRGDGVPRRAEVLTLGGGVRFFLPDDFVLGLEYATAADVSTTEGALPEGVEIGEPRLFVNFSKRF